MVRSPKFTVFGGPRTQAFRQTHQRRQIPPALVSRGTIRRTPQGSREHFVRHAIASFSRPVARGKITKYSYLYQHSLRHANHIILRLYYVSAKSLRECQELTQGPGRKPGASLYTRKRFSLSLCQELTLVHRSDGSRHFLWDTLGRWFQ